MTAAELMAQTRRDLAEVAEAIRSHRFLDRLRAGDVPRERLQALAAEEYAIVSSDRRSFAQLAARFPSGAAGSFFLGLAEGEGLALGQLRGLATWLNLTDDDLRAHEPHPGAQAYPALVAWLALNGSRADVALAFVANLAAWGENCGAVAAALREAYGAGDDAVGFFDFFAAPAAGLRGARAGGRGRGFGRGRVVRRGEARQSAAAGLRTLLLGRPRRRTVTGFEDAEGPDQPLGHRIAVGVTALRRERHVLRRSRWHQGGVAMRSASGQRERVPRPAVVVRHTYSQAVRCGHCRGVRCGPQPHVEGRRPARLGSTVAIEGDVVSHREQRQVGVVDVR